MSERGFENHFGGHASDYATGRPTYPESLFDALAEHAPGRALAWDVATGNGQAAVALAERFDRVIASDGSPEQLREATPHPRVTYVEALAEEPPSEASGADLITIAQALHWFPGEAFADAVVRTIRPGGLVAAWSYGRCEVTPDVDVVVNELHDDVLAPWWPSRRRHVLDGYRELDLPGEPVDLPPQAMEVRWDLDRLVAYLQTWSATRRCRADGGDPVGDMHERLVAAWGDPGARHPVRWPLTVMARRVSDGQGGVGRDAD